MSIHSSLPLFTKEEWATMFSQETFNAAHNNQLPPQQNAYVKKRRVHYVISFDKSAKKVEELVNDAVKKGAKLLHGGKKYDHGYFEPTVLDFVNRDMRIARADLME